MFNEPKIDRVKLALELAGTRGATSTELLRVIGGLSGGLYLALSRLERRGSIVSEWEGMPYPRRRRYWLSGFKSPATGGT